MQQDSKTFRHVLMPKIVIDSREQLPYKFAETSMVKALPVGDYSLEGMESRFCIERKELNDLIGCVTHDRNRFCREIQKAAMLKTFYLLIEADLSDLEAGRYRSKVHPNSVIGSLLAWAARFPNFKPIFAGTRQASERTAARILRREFIEASRIIPEVIE